MKSSLRRNYAGGQRIGQAFHKDANYRIASPRDVSSMSSAYRFPLGHINSEETNRELTYLGKLPKEDKNWNHTFSSKLFGIFTSFLKGAYFEFAPSKSNRDRITSRIDLLMQFLEDGLVNRVDDRRILEDAIANFGSFSRTEIVKAFNKAKKYSFGNLKISEELKNELELWDQID